MIETIEDKVLEVLKETFELDSVDKTISSQTCPAWDSMGRLNLIADLEEAIGVSIEPEEFGEMNSVDEIVRVLKRKGVE
jgi:acyl carrier protein